MQTGTKISGIGHGILIAVGFFGGAFRSDPLPFEVREVSVISSEDYAALTAPRQPPVAEPDQPPVPSAPEPVVQEPQEPAPEPVPPEPTPVEPEEAKPEPEPEPVPEPPAPRPVERVAPDPVAPPPEDAKPDDVAKPEVTNDKGADTPQPQQDATAPEEATDQIVTEANKADSLAPTRSIRPPSERPTRPTPPVVPAAEPKTEPSPDTSSAVTAALAEAMAGANPEPAAPAGPPLSAGEKDALRVAVSNCWNVGSLSSAALATTVVVAVSMDPDGKPQAGSIKMLSSSGGDDSSARDAFGAARRAIIRCGSKGFDLPVDKYDHWRDIEMTFNPERMRIK